MKIHQLPYGARFLYQGKCLTKTGPMLGTGEHGQVLIPRYAELQALDEAPAPQIDVTLPHADVLAAFETFFAECRLLVGEERASALEAARRRFLAALNRGT